MDRSGGKLQQPHGLHSRVAVNLKRDFMSYVAGSSPDLVLPWTAPPQRPHASERPPVAGRRRAAPRQRPSRRADARRPVEGARSPAGGLTDYELGCSTGSTRWWPRGSAGYVCVCNVHAVMASAEDPDLRTALLGSSVNVPDGQPLVWAMNALGESLEDRVYGPELMARACAGAWRRRRSALSTCTGAATRARSCSWR